MGLRAESDRSALWAPIAGSSVLPIRVIDEPSVSDELGGNLRPEAKPTNTHRGRNNDRFESPPKETKPPRMLGPVAAAESFGEGPVGEDAWAASGCLSRGRLASMAWVGKLRMRGEWICGICSGKCVFWDMDRLGFGADSMGFPRCGCLILSE
jgi:hypothetical protein